VAQWQEYLEVDSKNFQGDLWDFVLRRTTSHRPWTSNDRCVANGALS
jgi:hypothetical protein